MAHGLGGARPARTHPRGVERRIRMANDKPTPLNAKKRRVRGSTKQLRGSVWRAVLRVEELLDSDDPDMVLRAAHAMAALSRSYLAVVEETDLEARLTALENRLADIDQNGRRTA